MTDDHAKLNEFFINYGSSHKPGDAIPWANWQVSTEFRASLADQIYEGTSRPLIQDGDSSRPFSLFCDPVIKILLHEFEFIVRYFCGEFEIQTSDKFLREEFAGIWHEFIRGWYFGSIYIGFGRDFENLDRVKFERDGKNFDLDGIKGRFRIYTKAGESNQFHSVLSGQSGIVFTDDMLKRLVKVEQRGHYHWMFWFNLWMDMLRVQNRTRESIKALSKNVVMTARDANDAKSVRSQFENNDCFINREGSNLGMDGGSIQLGKTKFEEIIFMPRETPLAILEAGHRLFELEAAKMGYAGRIETQKKERINAGENYPHQKVVSNIRTYLLTSLNLIFDRLREKAIDENGQRVIPKDLKIVPTNQTMAEGLPHFQHGGTFNQFDKFGGHGFNKFNRFNKFQEDDRGND